ncbi:MAG TPA: glycosyltransferase family 2 protein [Sphingobacteriaceae bacterium]|nr:glycosyltransferase family 2 protein [Sphingobacteriaceae bacterium]
MVNLSITQNPKVSVIIPNYNHSPFLSKRIDSVLCQTYQDFEVIILDDCSTDSSKEIIESYKNHPKITKIVYNDVNSGTTFKQWDKGISLASGEYIWFAESDDWCENSLLECLVTGIESHKDCSISYCQSYCVEGDNKLRWTSHHEYLSEVMDGSEYIEKYLVLKVGIFNASMALWRKSLYEKIDKDYMSYKFSGDWRFWVELANRGKVHISGKVLNYFRNHNLDVSGKMYSSGLNNFEEFSVLHSLLNKNYIEVRQYHKGIKQILRKYFNNKQNFTPKVRAEFEREFKNIQFSNLSISSFILFCRNFYFMKSQLKRALYELNLRKRIA